MEMFLSLECAALKQWNFILLFKLKSNENCVHIKNKHVDELEKSF